MPAAAERLAYSFSVLHPVAAVRPGELTLFLFLLVTLMDAMRSLDVLSYHAWLMTLASRDLGCSRVTCHQPAYSYVSRFSLMPSTRLSRTSLCPVHRLVSFPCRFFLRPVLYPMTLTFVHLPDWTLFLSFTFTDSMPVCTCIVQACIYTGLEMGRSPSSIYFATTLVL